jgi:putative transposase
VFLEQTYGVSERRACRVLSLHRSTTRRQPGTKPGRELVARLHELSERYPRFGYRKIYVLLKQEHWRVSRETVRRIRQHEGLQVVKNVRKRHPVGKSTTTPTRAAHPNHVWSYDFVHDQTTDGRRLKCLTVLDEYTREGLTIHCARSITAGDVVQVLQRLFVQRGAPGYVKSDNGPEFIAQRVTTWLREQHVDTHFIDPGSPWQNGHNESFNAVVRDGCLDRWLFTSVQEARRIITSWLEEYNHERPHGALDGLTPHAFAAQYRYQSLGNAA